MFMGKVWRQSVFVCTFASIFSVSAAKQMRAEEALLPQDVLNDMMSDLQQTFAEKEARSDQIRKAYRYGMQAGDDEFERLFPPSDRPITRPISSGSSSPFQGFIPTHGAAYTAAVDVLYYTLKYFGVEHYFEKKGNNIDFVILSSSEGYFPNLDSSTVAFALREFSRYLVSHMCGDPSPENFYKIQSQVSDEDFGLYFKFVMAWALMGNYLPKEPNDLYRMGQKWEAVSQMARSQGSVQGEQKNELQKYTQFVTDILGVMNVISKSYCYTDITIKPREQIIWRVVTKRFLNKEKEIIERYAENKELVEEMRKREREQQRQSLNES